MATTQALLLPQIKDLLNIPSGNTSLANVTTWDTQLNNFMIQAVNLLWPIAQNELAPDISLTWPTSDPVLTLPAGVLGVRFMEVKCDGTNWQRVSKDNWYTHGTQLLLKQLQWAGKAIRIWGLGRYKLDPSVGANTTLPVELEQVIIYWTAALFYESLAGSKRKFDVYAGAAGAAADHDIKDSAQYMHDRGQELLDQRAPLRSS